MSDRAKKKHRKDLKRKHKSRDLHKARSVGPWKAIADGSGTLELWINPSWPETRQASIFAVRTIAGRKIFGAYLIDFGVPGLKDAWYRLDSTSDEIEAQFRASKEFGIALHPVKVEEAIRLIRGGIRFAHDNGFRLPHNFERTVSIVCPLGDWRDADVSDFDMEFAGSMDDLRRRLIGEPIETFLARRDVHFVIDNNTPSLLRDAELGLYGDDLDDGASGVQAVLETIDQIITKTIEMVQKWCSTTGETPLPMLEDAVEIFVSALATVSLEQASVEVVDPIAAKKRLSDILELGLSDERETNRQRLQDAIAQVLRFTATLNSPTELLAALP